MQGIEHHHPTMLIPTGHGYRPRRGIRTIQEVITISFYSRKLTDPQIRYTVTEKELLSIVKNLK